MKKVLSIVITLALSAMFFGCSNQKAEESSKSDIPTIATSSPVSKNDVQEETTTEAETTVVTEESTVTTAVPEKTVSLTDLTSIADSPKTTDRLKDNYGNTYGSAIISDGEYEYLVDDQYSFFKATLYVPEGETAGSNKTLTVKGDGFIIYNSPVMVKTSKSVEIEVPIAGFNKVRIEWYGDYYLKCCLADAVFGTSNISEITKPDKKTLPISIRNLTSIAEKPERTDDLTDIFDKEYSYAVYNNICNTIMTMNVKDLFNYFGITLTLK